MFILSNYFFCVKSSVTQMGELFLKCNNFSLKTFKLIPTTLSKKQNWFFPFFRRKFSKTLTFDMVENESFGWGWDKKNCEYFYSKENFM